MKKVTIILLSLLLVLVVGQAAFAKNYLGLTLGYNGAWGGYKYDYNDNVYSGVDLSQNSFKLGLYVNGYLTNRISLASEINIKTGPQTWQYYNQNGPTYHYEYKYTELNFNLFGRYDVLKLDIANVGVQVGLMSTNNILSEEGYKPWSYIASFIALGVYGDVDITSKLNIYTDLKFPIGGLDAWEEMDYGMSFFRVFLYDIILGATYEIYPNINLGLEANFSNINYGGIEMAMQKIWAKENGDDNEETKYFGFSIGAKLGYRF